MPVVTVLAAASGCGGSGSSAPSGSSTTAATVRNLAVSDAVRAQLLAAGAALHRLPATDYTGLVHGETYYAYDPATKTYWAGAGLVASRRSMRAQVGNQDDGAYLDFEKKPGGSWAAYDAGIPGSSNYRCAVAIPAAVVSAWGWAAGTCHPRG